MEKSEFLKMEYASLRDEIKEIKNRLFKIIGISLTVVPSFHFLAKEYNIDILIISLPIIVVIVAMIYIGESRSLMRCARYIRNYIEPNIVETERKIGWEQWLELEGQRNYIEDMMRIEKYLHSTYYLLFFIYFSISVFLAVRFLFNSYGIFLSILFFCLYAALFIWIAWIVIKLTHQTISTSSVE